MLLTNMSYLFLILLLILPFFGWVILRSFLNISSVIYLLPFSFVFGLCAYLVLLYALAYFFGVKIAVFISLFILFLTAIVFILSGKKDFLKIEAPININNSIFLFLVCFLIAFLTFLVTEKWVVWDFKFHLSVASHIARSDKFPCTSSNWPSLFIPYHFGFDLLSASLVKLSGISVMNSFRFVIVLSSIVTFLSAFAVSDFFLRKLNNAGFFKSLIGALVFYFSGNLLWLDAIFRYLFKIPPVDSSWSFLQTILGIGIHGSIITDIGSGGIFFASVTLGIQMFLLILFLFLYEKSLSLKYMISLLIPSIALFHCAEWILYIFLLSLIVSSFILFLDRNKKEDFKVNLLKNLLYSAIIFSIIIFNGIAYKILSSNYTYLPCFLELIFNPTPFFLRVFGRFGNLNLHRDVGLFSWDFISEFGIALILLPFIFYRIFKNNFNGYSLILSIILVSFVSPFILYIKSSPPDVIRLFHPGYELLGLFLFILLLDFLKTFKNVLRITLPGIIISTIVIPPILILSLSGIFSPAIYLSYPFIGFIDYSVKDFIKDRNFRKFSSNVTEGVKLVRKGSVIDDADIKIVNYLRKNSSSDEYGLSSYPFPFDYLGIPCYNALRGSGLARKITYVSLLQTFDPYLLEELKIKWFYLEPKTAEFVNLKVFEELIKNGYAREVLEVNSEVYGKGTLYEFVDLNKYMLSMPRKTYWTYFVYFTQNIIPLPDSSGKEMFYLFTSEKEATEYLKKEMKTNTDLKNHKPFVDAVSEEIIKQQAAINDFGIKYNKINFN